MANYVETLVNTAKAEVGYLEKASNSDLDEKLANAGHANFTKYARDLDAIPGFYNGKKQGFAWCDVFVDWCFVKAFGVDEAKKLLCQPEKSLGAGCRYSMNYYKQQNRFSTTPKIGDQIFFGSSSSIDHTGIVINVDNTYVYTVEGNTSSAAGVVDNGGAVESKQYKLNYKKILGYGHPAYDTQPVSAPEPISTPVISVKEWQLAAIADGYRFPKYGADGMWGSECESVAKRAICKKRLTYTNKNLTKIVQRVVGVTADGLFGKNTRTAVINYQRANNLSADGEVGINTWKKILNK